MKNALLFTVLGIALGVTGSISWRLHFAPQIPPPQIDTRRLANAPYYLMPSDFSPNAFYSDNGVFEQLRDADTLSVSLAEKNGGLKFNDHEFSKNEARLSEAQLRIFKETILSPNSYRGVTACSFNPNVLFRLKTGTKETIILVCLGCSDLGIGRLGADLNQATIGLTDIKTFAAPLAGWSSPPPLPAPRVLYVPVVTA